MGEKVGKIFPLEIEFERIHYWKIQLAGVEIIDKSDAVENFLIVIFP